MKHGASTLLFRKAALGYKSPPLLCIFCHTEYPSQTVGYLVWQQWWSMLSHGAHGWFMPPSNPCCEKGMNSEGSNSDVLLEALLELASYKCLHDPWVLSFPSFSWHVQAKWRALGARALLGCTEKWNEHLWRIWLSSEVGQYLYFLWLFLLWQ